jgi:PAS domain S-box-containing protein
VRLGERGSEEGGRVVSDALALLRGFPGLADDPFAHAALSSLEEALDPDTLVKSSQLKLAAELINSSLDLDSVLSQALEVAVEVMHAERGFIILREGRKVVALHNMVDDPSLGEPSRSIVERAMAAGEPIFTTDAQSDPHWSSSDSIAALHLRSIACVPLLVRERVTGAVYLDSRVIPGLFTVGDREILIAFAHQAAMAIENARLFDDERERRKRLSALQAFQTRILEAIASGVITLSPQREITTFNRAAEATFDMPSERMVGKPSGAIASLIPEFPDLLDMFFQSGAVQLRAEVEAYRTDGTLLTLEMRLAPLESLDGLGVAMVVTDVTKQRFLEEAVEADKVKAGRIRETFSRYLAPHVVKTLMDDPSSIHLGGERKRATMFFADVRGFTSLAAQMPADRVVEILNSYFEEAVRVVFEYDGLLDKFYGDGLMAVFGPPLVRHDDAARAVQAAIRLHETVAKLGPRLDYPLQISVGLATGDVVAGHFGSTKRMDYTVIGDAVNLANGLQSAAPPGAIYCDEETIASAGHVARPLHRLAARIKGRNELVTAYAIFPQLSKRIGDLE